ncbi:MAG: hypothetical protein GY839_07910 [candidate division Zixibacteria bacterium]|nr:hypothetical protein [candidate division Zixibacteria bacterium]
MSNTAILVERISEAINFILETVQSGFFWLGTAFAALLFIMVWFIWLNKRYKTSKITINIPFGLGNIDYDATDQDRILAWKMYIQLKTRKAALPFDENHDLVYNVYDSLHEIFPMTRNLLSEYSPHYKDVRGGISDFVLRVLNDGIRPHLTKWHSVFRKWWEEALTAPVNIQKKPQELQREFPEYDSLISELKRMNDELTKYAEILMDIVKTSPRRQKARGIKEKIAPEQP